MVPFSKCNMQPSNSTLRLAFALCITDDLSNPTLSIHIETQIPSMHLLNTISKTPINVGSKISQY